MIITIVIIIIINTEGKREVETTREEQKKRRKRFGIRNINNNKTGENGNKNVTYSFRFQLFVSIMS